MQRFSPSLRLLVLTTFALVLMCGGQITYAAKTHRAPRQVRQQIDDLEQQFRTATLNGDVALMDRLLSDDYVGITWNGQVNTKAAQLEAIRNRTVNLSRMDVSDIKVKLLGGVAIVTCAATIDGTTQVGPVSGVFRYTRVYQRLPGGMWKITNFEATRVPKHHHDELSTTAASTPDEQFI